MRSFIYVQRPFFEEILIVAIMRAGLCLFWKVRSVIYRQGLFFKEISIVAITRVNQYLF
jgi:hypothetical protein